MTQPIWKCEWSSDEMARYVDTTGVHDPELAVLKEAGDQKYLVYRFALERCWLVTNFDGGTCLSSQDPARESELPYPLRKYVPWYADDLDKIADTAGISLQDVHADLCSDDPAVRMCAYQAIGDYHGYDNLDTYPQEWTQHEADAWPDRGKVRVSLSQSADDDGIVTIYCGDVAACRAEQSVLGSRWECPGDLVTAYASVSDQADLVAHLEAEGYEVDASEYTPPDYQDFRYWHAKYEHNNGATPTQLAEIMGWSGAGLTIVLGDRRVQDTIRSWWTAEECETYIHACADAGWPLTEWCPADAA